MSFSATLRFGLLVGQSLRLRVLGFLLGGVTATVLAANFFEFWR